MSQVAKFKMEMDWKEFNVNLNKVNDWMKANAGDQYCGTQAAGKLELWFLEEPSQEIKDAVQAKWDAIHSDSAEATSYRSNEDIQAAIALAKEDAISKDWNSLSAQQRKLMMGVALSESDIDALFA